MNESWSSVLIVICPFQANFIALEQIAQNQLRHVMPVNTGNTFWPYSDGNMFLYSLQVSVLITSLMTAIFIAQVLVEPDCIWLFSLHKFSISLMV
jgi:hypothetical protein